MVENSLVLLKPDAVERAITGEIIARFERRGLKIAAMKMMKLSREQAGAHYEEHQNKPFFAGLVDFITSGPVIAMIVRGENAVKMVRAMMGTTNPLDSAPGTIRGDYATVMSHNVIHGSDSPVNAEREINIFFKEHEIF
ncbi:hypothetical protein P22_1649 [Propionispora sp. 2/2-37]|uniref:nucleoside-diphosphate kinase n=1 Tax=Propionispora sp. 2/2-37 TaxID=1677858 RepID=UPI0006BB93B7|nr:nucleoside-diphosphate kinase [Propionispora sp. 2/2-37]CUH95576.1 hypothetical protein P22_1649 [Propionispora sp. 2/2-37]